MYKKTVKYEDFDGKPVEEEFGFNINDAEKVIMQSKYPEGLSKRLRKIVAEDNKYEMVLFFRDLLLNAVGKRVGPLFVKNEEVRSSFEFSNAYTTMFMFLASDEKVAKEFVMGIMPKDTIPPEK